MEEGRRDMAQAYREIKTVTGDFARVQIFPVRPYQYGRKKKNKPTGAAMDKLNRERRARLLSDLVNLNFTKKDYQLKLDYSDFRREHGRNPEPDECVKLMRNFMRCLKRLYAAMGIELKYIYCSEIGVRGHISHHHVIINAGASLEQIKKLWRHGGVWTRKLYFDRKGAYDLAGYFVKSKYTYRSYTCSKNLRRPQETGKDKCIYKSDYSVRQKQVNAIMNGDVEDIRRMYPGWELAELPDVAYTVDGDTGEVRLPTWGVFITLFLYKPEGLTDAASIYNKKHDYQNWRG
jgi:hypothetical protein